MKTMKQVKVKDVFKAAAIFASAALTMAMFTACGKSGGSNPAPVVAAVAPVQVVPTCATCPGNSQLLAAGVGSSYYASQPESQIMLQFFGDGSVMQNYQSGNAYLQSNQSYYGTVAAQGTLNWNIASVLCGIPAGAYQITTVTPGQWQGQSFNNMILTATGPVALQIQMSGWIQAAVPSLVGIDGRQYPFKLVGQMNVRGQGTSAFGPMTCPISLY